jgi:hypothetical protein
MSLSLLFSNVAAATSAKWVVEGEISGGTPSNSPSGSEGSDIKILKLPYKVCVVEESWPRSQL